MRPGLGVLAAAVLLSSCADEPGTAPGSAPLFGASATVRDTYVILASGNQLPPGLAAAVAGASGTITATLDRVGVAIAASSDPGFRAAAGRIPGILGVAEDVTLRFDRSRGYGAAEASGGAVVPQTSVGAAETFRLLQWAPDAVSAPAAWDAGYLGAGARVAIVDGGIHSAHVDIAPNLDVARSTSFVAGQPYDFDEAPDAAGVCGVTDTFWHATHVAGVVAAPANGVGTVGIAPQTTIIGVKVLHCGSGAVSSLIRGIYYAATPTAQGGAGANIINLSLGVAVSGRDPGIALLLNALSRTTTYAYGLGVTVLAAAGNEATDLDHTGNLVFVPAQSANVIAVAATGPVGWALGSTDLDRPASYTNFGQSVITVAGPGGDFVLPPATGMCSRPLVSTGSVTAPCWAFDMVVAPCRGSGSSTTTYCWAAGTSMSTAAASGVAALIVGKYGPQAPAQVEARLRQAADDLGKPGNDDFYGRGRVNAWRAVQ